MHKNRKTDLLLSEIKTLLNLELSTKMKQENSRYEMVFSCCTQHHSYSGLDF